MLNLWSLFVELLLLAADKPAPAEKDDGTGGPPPGGRP
jgi:hypothetical protein